MLYEYFTRGTGKTKTGSMVGIEVETDFVDENNVPITSEVSGKLLGTNKDRPAGVCQKLELGRQKIEVSIEPQPSADLAIEAMQEALAWLYVQAKELGAKPVFAPEIDWDGRLLVAQEERDAIWVELDGEESLEQLCRCSSVQFTVDANPEDAITMINNLHAARLQQVDYDLNHQRWLKYIRLSRANYRSDRYGGPDKFESLDDYVARLIMHEAVMHRGQPVRESILNLNSPDIDLFLRSVWWHYRLRRYGDSLSIEIRPLARREDDTLPTLWRLVAKATGL